MKVDRAGAGMEGLVSYKAKGTSLDIHHSAREKEKILTIKSILLS